MNDPGAIHAEEAYALGKMLDHSSWWRDNPKLPRAITPSDVDYPMIPLVFDNNGRLIFCELTHRLSWSELSAGQRWLYESIIKNSWNFAVLCSHNVRPEMGRRIDTRYDIQSFQVMIWDFGFVRSKVINGNATWQNFVFAFYRANQAEEIRRRIGGRSVGLVPELQSPKSLESK